jgi:dGTPase
VYVGSEAKDEEPKVHHLIRSLFDYFCQHTDELPPETHANPRHEPVERLVVDYISGMTDRFAIATFERIFVPRSWDIK